MISWALGEERVLIENEEAEYCFYSIEEALSRSIKREYFCPECFHPVIPKRGIIIQPHFSHKEGSSIPCRIRLRQKARSVHRNIQEKIYNMMGREEEAAIEHFFSEIRRVADVAHFPSKTVYEVQVSWLHPKIAIERTLAYWKIGWRVVWILYSDRFHHKLSSDFQEALILCGIPYYYSKKPRIQEKSSCFFDMLYENSTIQKKELMTLQIEDRYSPLPISRLLEWLLWWQENTRKALFHETKERRQELWPYNIKEDLLKIGAAEEKTRGLFPLSFKPRAFLSMAREAWLQFLCRL